MYHTGDRGLYLKVTGPGAASWVLRYQLDRKPREMGLGPYPELTLLRARDKAEAHRRMARVEKIDPLTHRHAERSQRRALQAKQRTVKQLIEEFAFFKCNSWGIATHHGFDINMKNHVLPKIGDMLVPDVNVAMIRQVLEPFGRQNPSWRA